MVFVGLVGIGTAISLISKWDKWKDIGIFFESMFRLKPPDVLLLALILGIFVLLIFLIVKFRGFLNKNIQKTLKDNKKKSVSVDDFKKRKNYPDLLFILTKLGNQDDLALEHRILWERFKGKFEKKSIIDLNRAINYLKIEECVEEFESPINDEICYEITSKGLDLYDRVRERV